MERGKAGCGSVKLNTKLRTAMRLHVQELGTHGNLYISHVSDDGRSFVDRAKAQGYNDPGGENVARGQRDAADVMNSWMNSEGHRANILNCGFKAIGVGAVKGVDGTDRLGTDFRTLLITQSRKRTNGAGRVRSTRVVALSVIAPTSSQPRR